MVKYENYTSKTHPVTNRNARLNISLVSADEGENLDTVMFLVGWLVVLGFNATLTA